MKKWMIDCEHSAVGFEIRHMMVAKVRGQFDTFVADVQAEDITNLTTAEISFTFEADSINTRNEERDNHLMSPDFFDVNRYPTIEFYSTHIIKSGDLYKVTGPLTIKGNTKRITFEVSYGGQAANLSGTEVYGYEAQAVINREDFGLTWNTVLESGGVLIGKEVTINIDLELIGENNIEQSNQQGDKNESLVERKRLQDVARQSDIHRTITENLTNLIVIINKFGDIQYVSPSLSKTLNEDMMALENRNFFDKVHVDDLNIVRQDVLGSSSRIRKNALENEFRFYIDGKKYINVEATITGINIQTMQKTDQALTMIVMRDISDKKEVENVIYQLAFHDSLTNLPNRRSFLAQLQNDMMKQKLPTSKLSVLFIDIDDFKMINDQWGHDIGDYVLVEIAERIQSSIRSSDVAARFGGDEFVVLLREVENKEQTTTIVQRMLAKLKKPIIKSEQTYTITCSVGVAHYPGHGETAEDLIKHADIALYYVKERHKNDFIIFDQSMKDQSLENKILENALRQGIKEKQFYLEYQPKVNMDTNELIGMEVLTRWNHPELGVIPPGKFIPLAEETGLIIPLGEWILQESCRQLARWQKVREDKNAPPLILSVNVSVRQLEISNFAERLKLILEETGINPPWLELEITESILANVRNTSFILKDLQNLGVHISVDDFGTGYSSLNYIKELPIDTLKIDRSFVHDIHTNQESREIIKAMINLAKSIGLNVIAEGIEVKEHVDEFRDTNDIFGQGYYYSHPLKGNDFEAYLNKTTKDESMSF